MTHDYMHTMPMLGLAGAAFAVLVLGLRALLALAISHAGRLASGTWRCAVAAARAALARRAAR